MRKRKGESCARYNTLCSPALTSTALRHFPEKRREPLNEECRSCCSCWFKSHTGSVSLSTVLMKTASSLSSCPPFVSKAVGMDLKAWLGRDRQTSGEDPKPSSDLGSDLDTVRLTHHLGDPGDLRDLRSRLDVHTCVCMCHH